MNHPDLDVGLAEWHLLKPVIPAKEAVAKVFNGVSGSVSEQNSMIGTMLADELAGSWRNVKGLALKVV